MTYVHNLAIINPKIKKKVTVISRPQKCRYICSRPQYLSFGPLESQPKKELFLGYDEYEALRLIDCEGYTQSQCAKKMNVSRTTVTRIYQSARGKISDALVNGKAIRIQGGDVLVCAGPKPECQNVPHCCHRQNPKTEKNNRQEEEI